MRGEQRRHKRQHGGHHAHHDKIQRAELDRNAGHVINIRRQRDNMELHFHPTDQKGEKIPYRDPGESNDDGSLIISKYGKGYFTYTGLVFFRELPAGVPGAYRLLANIIALNKKKAF